MAGPGRRIDGGSTSYCPGCGRRGEACAGACGRAEGTPRFCDRCGRRLVDMSLTPGWVQSRCRDHGSRD